MRGELQPAHVHFIDHYSTDVLVQQQPPDHFILVVFDVIVGPGLQVDERSLGVGKASRSSLKL